MSAAVATNNPTTNSVAGEVGASATPSARKVLEKRVPARALVAADYLAGWVSSSFSLAEKTVLPPIVSSVCLGCHLVPDARGSWILR